MATLGHTPSQPLLHALITAACAAASQLDAAAAEELLWAAHRLDGRTTAGQARILQLSRSLADAGVEVESEAPLQLGVES